MVLLDSHSCALETNWTFFNALADHCPCSSFEFADAVKLISVTGANGSILCVQPVIVYMMNSFKSFFVR